MENMEVLETLVFLKIESKILVSWGILMQIFQKVIYFQIQSSYDIIIGISQGLVTLPFLKVEAQNLVSLGILTCSLKFQYFISIISFAGTL